MINLLQVVVADILPDLARLASATLLQMLVNLRVWYRQCKPSENGEFSEANTSLAFSNSNAFAANQSQLTSGPKTNTLNLKYILKNIVEWIIISSVSSQKLKINLYASLLNFMHIIKGMNKETSFDDHEHEK